MSKRTIHNILQEIVEEEIPANSVDLWPQISQRLEAKPAPAPKRQRGVRLVYRMALVILAGAAAFLMTPQGRTLAQEYLPQFFERAESNTRPIPSEVFVTVTARAEIRATETQFATEHPEIPTPTPTITPTPGPGSFQGTIEEEAEIEEQLGYDVLVPGWLPLLLTDFAGFSFDLEQGIAYQNYGSPGDGMRIQQYPADLDIDQPEIAPSQYISVVDINGNRGEYVTGSWVSKGNKWVWTSNPYDQRLRWEQDGMIFQLQIWAPPGYYDKNDMIEIAESMH